MKHIDSMRVLLIWLRSNYKFVLLILSLLFIALISVAYAFVRADSEPPRASPTDSLGTAVYEKEEPLETIPATSPSQSDQAAGQTAAVSSDPKCLQNPTALVAANLKIEKEVNNHKELVKQIGHGGLVNKVAQQRLAEEDARHQQAMEHLRQEYEALVRATACS